MQPIKRWAFHGLILAGGLTWILFSATQPGYSNSSQSQAPQKGFLAPDFTLATPAGLKYTLSQERGQAVLLNLWATWCPPCRAEMPVIEEYYRQYKDQGFIVLAVNATNQDNPLDIAPFVSEYSLSFPILLDETGEAARLYDLRSLPSSYFINRDGTIQEVVIGGPMSEALLKTNIESILKSRSN